MLASQLGVRHISPYGARDVFANLPGEERPRRGVQGQRRIQSAQQATPGQPGSAHTGSGGQE